MDFKAKYKIFKEQNEIKEKHILLGQPTIHLGQGDLSEGSLIMLPGTN